MNLYNKVQKYQDLYRNKFLGFTVSSPKSMSLHLLSVKNILFCDVFCMHNLVDFRLRLHFNYFLVAHIFS